MALNLSQIDKVFDPALILPIGGKEYRVEDVPALLGLYCQRVWAASLDVARVVLTGDGNDEQAVAALGDVSKLPLPPGYPDGTPLHIAVLGDTYQKMLDDGVTGRWIEHAGLTVVAWLAAGDDVAAEYWAAAGRPERMAPNRKQRRAGASTSTGGANGTPSRGSSSGTTSRRKGSRGRGSRSAGTTS